MQEPLTASGFALQASEGCRILIISRVMELPKNLCLALSCLLKQLSELMQPETTDDDLYALVGQIIIDLDATGVALYIDWGAEDGKKNFVCRGLPEDICESGVLRNPPGNGQTEDNALISLDGNIVHTVAVSHTPVFCRFSIFYTAEPGPDKMRLAGSLTEFMASIVGEKGHYREMEQRLYESAALAEIGRAIVSTLDMERVVSQIVKVVAYIMNAMVSLIIILDEQSGEPKVKAGYGLERLENADILQRHAVNLFSEAVARRDFPAISSSSPGPEKLLCLMVPLTVVDRVMGTVVVCRDQPFYEHEISLMRAAAVQASVALENARLHKNIVAFTERELSMAAAIQRSLLPRELPKADGFDFGSTIAFMREVGGDYYDFVDLGGGKWGLSIADVSGKSVPAAILVGMTKYVLRTNSVIFGSPEKTLRGANSTIVSDISPDMFITMFYGILDTSGGRFSYANAGHEPPLLFREKGHHCSFLEPTGIVLGVDSQAEYGLNRLHMEPGDWLILYTDGVIEARSQSGELFGSDRICRAVEELHHISAQLMTEYLYKKAFDFAGGDLRDDVAIVAVKRN